MYRSLTATLATIVAALLTLAGAPSSARAQPILYGATGGAPGDGHLYILNSANGAVVSDIGPLMDAGGNPYGLSGLAYNAATDTLYGSTSNQSTTAPGSLVTINRATAQVTLIGSFNLATFTLTDLTFQPGTGTLFGWGSQTNALHTVDLTTGNTTQIGSPLTILGGGGALAFNFSGTLYSLPDGTGTHTLDTINPATGVHTVIGPLTGAFSNVVNAMKFNGGTLFANFSGSAGVSHFGTIDVTTAAATDLGPTVNYLDALAFVTPVPEPGSLALTGVGLAGLYRLVRRRGTSTHSRR